MSTAMRGAVAALLVACVMASSACSALVKRPSGASVIADMSFGVATYWLAKDMLCEPTGEDWRCEWDTAQTIVFGGPFLLIGGVAGAWAVENPPPDPDAPAAWNGELPARATDAETLQLARTVRTAVRSGHCVAARATMDRIAERDAEYHIAMLASGVLATCP